MLIAMVSKKQRSSFNEENHVLCVGCENPDSEPREIADLCNERFSGALNGDRVIRIFKRCRLGHISYRKKLFNDVSQTADILIAIISGDMPLSKVLDITAKLDGHAQKKRLILMQVTSRCTQIRESEVYSDAMRMNKDFAAECLDAIIYAICEKDKVPDGNDIYRYFTPEEYQRKINDLEMECVRANNLLKRLQESFDTQLAESRIEEQIRLISNLNSEKYGFVLDLLVSAQRGFKRLRSQKIDIPYELKDVMTLVRRLLEFTEDCGVTHMMDVGTKMQVCAADVEGYVFDGKPFVGEDEIKHVEVISPGWQMENQDIVLSYPRLKEISEVKNEGKT